MVILAVHNHYRQPGGEDQVFAAETDLLESRNHQVARFTRHNDEVGRVNPARLAGLTVWNRETYRQIRVLIRQVRPNVVHVHNTVPLVSPSVYFAARAERVPVVQTLHNYRLYCVNALFFRNGRVCEACAAKPLPWPGVLHACYRRSRVASAGVAAAVAIHRALGTWTSRVDAYIALTGHAKRKFVQLGLPASKVFVKPNFLYPDPGPNAQGGRHGLFVGRLSPEKGLGTLLAAAQRLAGAIPLVLIGDGPLAGTVRSATERLPGMSWLGAVSLEEVYQQLGRAMFLVLPSEWYEGFPRVLVESFARGTPVLAARLGALAELVEHGRTGRLFEPGDPDDLARQMAWLASHPREVARMRVECRREFEAKYTPERNYDMLMDIYRDAVMRNGGNGQLARTV